MSTTLNILDIIFLTFTAIFVLTAFFRGFVKEIFSLLNWIVALALSYFLAPYANDLLDKHFENRLLLEGITRSVIFILAFIITAISTSGLRDSMQDKMPKSFDRSLGMLYGFIKTLLIFGFVYSLYFDVYGLLLGNKLKENSAKEPQWLVEAKCYSLLKLSGDILEPVVKKFFEAITENFDKTLPQEKNLDEKIDEVIKQKDHTPEAAIEKIDSAIQTKKDAKEKAEDSGYSKKDIEKMNRLIDIIDK